MKPARASTEGMIDKAGRPGPAAPEPGDLRASTEGMIEITGPQNTAEVVESIGPLYLQLLREQYLDEDVAEPRLRRAFFSLVARICAHGHESLIQELLLSSNWREVLVGAYCIVSLQEVLFRPEPGSTFRRQDGVDLSSVAVQRMRELVQLLRKELATRLLGGSTQSFPPVVARPLCIAAAALKDRESLEAFLNLRPLPTDAVEEFAAALAGYQATTGFSAKEAEQTHAELLESLRQDPCFDPDAFEESKRRCIQALAYWSGDAPSTEKAAGAAAGVVE